MDNKLFYKGFYGLERETMRVDESYRLAQTPHPFSEESITRDFCENQTELITPVCHSIDEAVNELKKLDKKVRETLDKQNEKIWLYSNPPHIDREDEIPVANFTGRHSGKRAYREQLEQRYGKKLMLFSGVHFNFSFDDEYLKTLFGGEDFSRLRDEFYLRLYKQLCRYSWLLLILTAASPLYDRSLFEDGAEGVVLSEYASIRNSEKGYWNSFVPILRFESLDDFVKSIEEYVENGQLFSASELYLPIRLKPKGNNHISNFKNGVSHVELRMFDLDPTSPLGIDERDLEFAHLLIMYLSTLPDLEYTPKLQEQAIRTHKEAARFDLDKVYADGVPILQKAEEVIDEMSVFFGDNSLAQDILAYEKDKPTNRLCERIEKNRTCG